MSDTETSRAEAWSPSEAHWPAFRSRIPATSSRIYFNSGWSGPLPSPVVEAVEGRLRRECARDRLRRPCKMNYGRYVSAYARSSPPSSTRRPSPCY